MNHNKPILTRIKAVYNALEDLKDKVVFVGGAVVSLYADRVVHDPRPTDDIDVLVEILNYRDHVALEEKLHQKGFINDQDSGIACRYRVQGITVDIMPTDDRSFGFDSMWYSHGFHNAVAHPLDDTHVINILTAPYYLATKLEAFRNRGNGDGRTSQDFEDIVFILENRAAIWEEIKAADENLKTFLIVEFGQLLSEPNMTEWVYSHIEKTSGHDFNYVMASLEKLVNT